MADVNEMKEIPIDELENVVGGMSAKDNERIEEFNAAWTLMGLDSDPDITAHQKDAAMDEFLMQKLTAAEFLKKWNKRGSDEVMRNVRLMG